MRSYNHIMLDDAWRTPISIDTAIHHGEPCIAGTRVLVRTILACLGECEAVEDVLHSWPQLNLEDVQAGLRFSPEAVGPSRHIPITPSESGVTAVGAREAGKQGLKS